jgi:hypothetical protein
MLIKLGKEGVELEEYFNLVGLRLGPEFFVSLENFLCHLSE